LKRKREYKEDEEEEGKSNEEKDGERIDTTTESYDDESEEIKEGEPSSLSQEDRRCIEEDIEKRNISLANRFGYCADQESGNEME
jgi:hypothetical protein